MSFDLFVDDNPLAAHGLDASTSEDDVAHRLLLPSSRPPVAIGVSRHKKDMTMELDDDASHGSGQNALWELLPGLAYAFTFIMLMANSHYSTLIIHMISVGIAIGAERLCKSIVRQVKLDDIGNDSLVGVILYTAPLVVSFNIYQICVARPMAYVLKTLGWNVELADINRVPMRRRKQTMAVLLWSMLIPMVIPTYVLTIVLTFYMPFFVVPYLIWIYFVDSSPCDGSRQAILRDTAWAKYFVDYFPITLERASLPLDPSRKYVFGFHPHGIVSFSAIGALASNAAGFPALFPGIDRRLLGLASIFNIPFLREIILSLGCCSVARKSCDTILNRGPGSAIIIIPGGAAESLETKEGTYRLNLNRKGFIRMAIDNNADLVPVFAFGETNVFNVYVPGKDSKLRKLQIWAQKKMGFGIPIFWGRGVLSYNWGFLPMRKPLNVITGPPIRPSVFKDRGLEGEDLVTAVHAEYVQALRQLYDDYKDCTVAGRARTESMQVVDE